MSRGNTPQNRMLRALPRRERELILSNAELINAAQGHVLYGPGIPIRSSYFPESGMASELIRLEEGQAADVSPVGNDGLLGLALMLGNGATSHEGVMQISGALWRIRATDIRRVFEQCHAFHNLVDRYAYARFVQASQSCACNLLHSVHQRMARWLLVALGYVQAPSFRLTQEYFSEMVGANRSTVTLVMREFQRAGILDYWRGTVQIRNQERLLEAACECHRVIASAIDRVFA